MWTLWWHLACSFSFSWSRFPWARAVSRRWLGNKLSPIAATTWTLGLAEQRHRTWALALRTNPPRNTLPLHPRHQDMHPSSTCHLQRHKSREYARRDQHAGLRNRRSIPSADACKCPKCACPSLQLSVTHAYTHTHPSPCCSTSTLFSVLCSTQKLSFTQRGSGSAAGLAGAWRSAVAPCFLGWLGLALLASERELAWAPRELAWPVDH